MKLLNVWNSLNDFPICLAENYPTYLHMCKQGMLTMHVSTTGCIYCAQLHHLHPLTYLLGWLFSPVVGKKIMIL